MCLAICQPAKKVSCPQHHLPLMVGSILWVNLFFRAEGGGVVGNKQICCVNCHLVTFWLLNDHFLEHVNVIGTVGTSSSSSWINKYSQFAMLVRGRFVFYMIFFLWFNVIGTVRTSKSCRFQICMHRLDRNQIQSNMQPVTCYYGSKI